MSRMGSLPIRLPENVFYKIDDLNVVTIEGPKGKLTQNLENSVVVKNDDGMLFLHTKDSSNRKLCALQGVYRVLLSNMITGVTIGFKKSLEIIGVGFKVVKIDNTLLDLDLGFSHKVYFQIPSSIDVTVENEKGKNIVVTFEGINKQLVGQVAAKMRDIRKVDVYKGKGIRYVGEYVRHKEGKQSSK